MKHLTILGMAFTTLLMNSSLVIAEETNDALQQESASQQDSGTSFAYGGDFYLALQNWSDVGMSSDSKLGFGFGADFGIGVKLDDTKFLIGPHLAMNRWSADYSDKANSATDTVYVEMYDMGLQFSMLFDDFYLSIGKGTSEISSGFTVNGTDYKYPYDGDTYDYSAVSVGMKMDNFMIGLGAVNYDGYAKYCNRAEIQLGFAF
jgi:hypothetical protein